jgi:large subunit ribosomal protein L13
MKTYSLKAKDVTRKWYILDAREAPLGRIATVAARLLIGKDKPSFTPHVDGGDYVVITNAASLVVTGGKETKKTYYRHSGYPGGLYKRSLGEQMQQDPTKVLTKAVRGMLPVNKLRPQRLARLKVYPGEQHPHEPQQPTKMSLKKEKS